ncbi:MAG: nucleotidyltransferase domain-containing protein [Candidatus Jordarchaeales archaeon]|nr:nucleotidyltransferase domain-containing protein [Candidatus Jordarchaeia archaeon]
MSSRARVSEGHIEVARRVKSIVHSIDPEAKVYIFGSAARGEATAMSDIDVMVVTGVVERKYEMMVKVYRSVEENVELHVVTEELLEKWYRRFIPAEELIEV